MIDGIPRASDSLYSSPVICQLQNAAVWQGIRMLYRGNIPNVF